MSTMFYCIDPGLAGTGVAAFRDKKLEWWINIYPKAEDFKKKAKIILFTLGQRISGYSPIFIEWPTSNFGGLAGTAAANSDAILKLCYLIGMIAGNYTETILVPVQKWKGSLPKDVVKKRAEEFFKKKGFKSHAADAVGIGQYVIQNNLV